MEELRFGNQYVFQDLDDANMVYMAILLSVGREARGKGLGTELMKRGYQVAKKVKFGYFLNNYISIYKFICNVLSSSYNMITYRLVVNIHSLPHPAASLKRSWTNWVIIRLQVKSDTRIYDMIKKEDHISSIPASMMRSR